MPHSSFTDMDKFATIMALLAGTWGAILSFVRRDKNNMTLTKKILFFFADMFVNIGLTMLTYIGLIGYGFNDLLAVAISGFIGHQGVRSVYLVELIIVEKLGAKATFEEIKKNKEKKE